jgi:hypothetical protein
VRTWWFEPAATVALLWLAPLVLAIWAFLEGRTLLGAVFAAWCLIGSRRVMPVVRQALAERRATR